MESHSESFTKALNTQKRKKSKHYQKTWAKWSAYPFVDDFLYSPEDESTKHSNGKKIQVLLPVIINEKRYEYQFVFEIENITFGLMNFDYYKNSRVADELR